VRVFFSSSKDLLTNERKNKNLENPKLSVNSDVFALPRKTLN